jgi:CHAD domain-containing protein
VKALRKLRQHLGPARDLDVMLGHLKEIKGEGLKAGVEWLTDQLTRQQKELRESEAEKFDVPKALARLGVWWGVRQDWADAGDGLESLISESLHLQLDEFIEHADAVAGKSGAKNDAQMLDPHQLRIAGKALRYTLEMAVEGGHRLPAAVGRSFKRMQDALGLWHDYAVLDVAKLALRRSATQLEQFNKLWNAKGEMLATTIRQAFPLTHPVPDEPTESKTDPDPSDSEKPAEDHSAPPATVPGESSAA